MLEISPDIPFLANSEIRFLVWDRAPQSLETWNWADGTYLFFQSRSLTIGKEYRFGGPLWGIPSYCQYVEYPFYLSSDPEAVKDLSNVWAGTLENKTIAVLISADEEENARLQFAKILLSSNQNLAWESVAKQFGLIGENYLLLEEFSKDVKKPFPKKNLQSRNAPPISIIGSPLVKEVRPEPETFIAKTIILEKKKEEVLTPEPIAISVSRLEKESLDEVREEMGMSVPTNIEVVEAKEAILPSEPETKPIEIKTESKNGTSVLEKKEEVVSVPTHQEEPPKSKFSIQVKMMGVISLLFILSVSSIIIFASFFFKRSTELSLRANNLELAEIVGLKVKDDILSVVVKGRQIATTLTSQGLPEDQRKLLIRTFFESDKEFIYLGIFEKQGDLLVLKKHVFNEEELKQSSLTEEDFQNVVLRNKDALAEAFNGQPILLNSSPGFQEPSFAIAIPASENGQLDNILVMIVKLDKIISAFEKKGIQTVFMVNGKGIVIAHPKEDLVLAATDLSSMPIVRTMLTSAANKAQSSYIDPELKSPFLGSFQKIGLADAGVITIVSEDKAFEDVYDIQRKNLYIMGIGLCSAILAVFFFSKTITKPILLLLSATLEIAKGNFRVGIKPTTKDEVGMLTQYFVEMGHGLEEREKVKSILGSMIDPVVVQEAMVDLAALKRGSEANITAFFSDIAGFSTISEQLKSADLAALLNEYLSAMTLILKRHDGVLDKYIGDAIVGIFNAPVLVPDHELKAARASVEMIAKLADLREYWTKNNLYSKEAQAMDCRIGLNSGLAKVGFMGTDALASYTMMGDTVNLAARLEAAGKDYGVNILISDSVKQATETEMFSRYLDLVRVKGKNEPVKIHELIGFRSEVSQNIIEAGELYESGFTAYLNQDWDKAISLFENAEKAKGKKDKASHLIIERCLEYKLSSPGKDWDGVFTRTHK
ncbi:adenylate/guanylate cyclase domain-containing protein [Leptospira ilyithenensis]|uniref:HAMP domain-containing protein n=1 Tax=Leptospira ilyithenensis TaxID=2484901 RepID=A0A4R9LLB6_9LEPT|nr:adenylate/guanylate cyclase domain-containing protein [Leptospira ilyithenensis]TGN08405.1 HAMP domain-containing protein [Leptospira ilyithenensis]